MDTDASLRKQFTGVILAGGSSTRFGTPKADVQWRGRALLGHVAARLRETCGEIVAVARPGQPTAGWPVDRVVSDDPALTESPLRGMVAGLSACRTPVRRGGLVVACDTPCLAPPLLARIQAGLTGKVDASVPEWDGRLQPLLAAYAPGVGPRLLRLLTSGQMSPRAALAHLQVAILPEDECRRLDPSGLSFCNLNTPEDLARLDRLLAASPPAWWSEGAP